MFCEKVNSLLFLKRTNNILYSLWVLVGWNFQILFVSYCILKKQVQGNADLKPEHKSSKFVEKKAMTSLRQEGLYIKFKILLV